MQLDGFFASFLGGCTKKTRRVFGYVPGYPNPAIYYCCYSSWKILATAHLIVIIIIIFVY